MKCILFVDDDEDIREIFEGKLTASFEAEVVLAGSGHEAIEILKQGKVFDFIISDYSMPNGTGQTLLAFMAESGIEIPTVIFTNSFNPSFSKTNSSFYGVINKNDSSRLCQVISESFQRS